MHPQTAMERQIETGRNSVKNKFFTHRFVPAAQSQQVVERTWLLVWHLHIYTYIQSTVS